MTDSEMLKDHESRLRKLEESDIRQQIQLGEIQKSQMEIKLMINTNTMEQQKTLNHFTEQVLTTLTQTTKKHIATEEKVKWHNTKSFWAIASATATAIILHFTK